MAKKQRFGALKGDEFPKRVKLTTGASINETLLVRDPNTGIEEDEQFTSLDDLVNFLAHQNPSWLNKYMSQLGSGFHHDGLGVELKIKIMKD